MQIKTFKEYNQALAKFMSPKAMDDFNTFLEKLPQNTNKSLLIMTAIIWGSAATLGLYTTVKMQEFAELYIARDEARALVPVVPKIQDKPVRARDVQTFVDELQGIYKGLEIKGNSSNINIRAKSTAQFGQFREAIGHVQNGGLGWRVDVERLCIGKECKQYPLSASLKINSVSVEKVSTE
ncbi:MAG: hypothetical protein COA45_05015 [Zetaproteobacteria bacterium]|nr:MAG: hypothetical protein COA45_05015 [Zetaproteobacteria bacterium]